MKKMKLSYDQTHPNFTFLLVKRDTVTIKSVAVHIPSTVKLHVIHVFNTLTLVVGVPGEES